MFGIGSTELAIILVFGFLLFGPDKLPQMGRTIGRALRQFRETQEKLTAVVQTEVVDPMAAAAQSGAKKAGVAVDDDSDADVPASEGSASEPARKETFAERRARLAAEKAEAEAAKAAGATDAAGGPAEEVSVEGEATAPEVEDAPEPAVAEQPVIRTTEDLYARSGRRRRAIDPAAQARAKADEEPDAVSAPAEESTSVAPASEDTNAEAEDVSSDTAATAAAEGGEQ